MLVASADDPHVCPRDGCVFRSPIRAPLWVSCWSTCNSPSSCTSTGLVQRVVWFARALRWFFFLFFFLHVQPHGDQRDSASSRSPALDNTTRPPRIPHFARLHHPNRTGTGAAAGGVAVVMHNAPVAAWLSGNPNQPPAVSGLLLVAYRHRVTSSRAVDSQSPCRSGQTPPANRDATAPGCPVHRTYYTVFPKSCPRGFRDMPGRPSRPTRP
jgi:hypothetical protein